MTEQTIDTTPLYQQLPKYTLTILPEVVVLPTDTNETTGTKTNDGTINTEDITFNCNNVNLKKGSTVDEVRKLQTILKARGYYTRQIDGDYGKYTKNAVKKLQSVQGNTTDGWFGPKTCKKLQQTNTTSNTATGTTNKKQKNYTITDFENTPQLTTDMEALSDEINIKTTYTKEKQAHLRKLQKTEFTLHKGKTLIRKHKGYISEIKTAQEEGRYTIELRIVGYTDFLNQQVEFEKKTAKRSQLLKELIELAGLKPNINMNGLPDDEYTLNMQSSNTNSNTEGNGSKTVEECFQMAKDFVHTYHTSKRGLGTSTHDPETAWKGYQQGNRVFDCFGCSAFLYYTISNFAKKPVRVIHRASKSASSGTHYTVQLKNNNGEWYDPKDLYKIIKDSLLPPNSGSIIGIHQVYEG